LFLVCASLTPLVLAGQPMGLREIQALMSSSILGAEASDAVVMVVLAMMAVGVGMVAGRKLVLLVTDPTMAAAVGMGVGLWWTGLAVGVGLTTGLCLQRQGMLFTFGCLVLPPLVARDLSATTARMFWISPLVGVLGTVAGLVVAHRVDLPPGQTIVAMLGGTLVLVWGVRHLLSFLGRRSHCSAPPAGSVPVAEGLSLSVENPARSLSGLAGTGSCLRTGFRHGES
jgi:ABC-type Mn2+/Zn2+ transport system permease subunit